MSILMQLIWFALLGPAVHFYSVPSTSMSETLLIGDMFVGYEDAYVAPVGSTDPAPSPQRGDVVVVQPPGDGSVYVKRVIGLPGDRIQMIGGELAINGVTVPRERLADDPSPDLPPGARRFAETLPNGRTYVTLDVEEGGFLDDTPEFDVPPDHYFLLGDNRDNSVDSRMPKFGMIARADFVAKAGTIIFSISEEEGEVRLDRFFRQIQ